MSAPSGFDQTQRRRWNIAEFDLVDSPIGAASPPDDADWIPAVVPGGVHESLIAAGKLDHPYRDLHEKDCAWVEERSWWYRAKCEAPEPSANGDIVLDFTGVDTVATVWINGRQVAEHASQFRPLEVPLASTSGVVEILIRCDPPLHGLPQPEVTVEAARKFQQMTGGDREDGESISDTLPEDLSMTLRRKAFDSWGWDFAPRVPSIGLTGEVFLTVRPAPRLDHASWQTLSLTEDSASCRLTVEGEGLGAEDRVRYRLTSPAGSVAAEGAAKANGSGEIVADVEVPDPDLWWTHDLGAPALYQLDVELEHAGKTADTRSLTVGIRTIRIDETPDEEGGRRFQFVLNGQPTFARGANWVPADMLTGSVTREIRENLLTLARDAGMTMIRVWGGGYYEPDEFYELCDQLGLLVWQDFMFTSVEYPDDDPDLRAEVEAEASYQVKRLSSHPSLAVWAGNNEAHAMHDMIWQGEERSGWGGYFYDDLLPRTVNEHGAGVPYRRGSPDGTIDSTNGVLDGDRHAWEVWHGEDIGAGPAPEELGEAGKNHFWRYSQDQGRFISEFGICSIPEMVTLDRWVTEPIQPWDQQFLHRVKDNPKDKIMGLLSFEAGTTSQDGMAAQTIASQMVQAEGLAYGIAHYRRRQPICSGTLVWQLNEPWPGLSWSLIDFEGLPKPAWYAVRDAFAPVVASLRQESSGAPVEVWVTNSAVREWAGTLTARLRKFSGETDSEREVEVHIPAGESRKVAELPVPDDPRSVYAQVRDGKGRIPTARLFLDHLKNLPIEGTVTSDVRAEPDDIAAGRAYVTVRAEESFAYAVRVQPLSPENRFDAAYFDLAPGESRTITVRGLTQGFDPSDIAVRTWGDDLRESESSGRS